MGRDARGVQLRPRGRASLRLVATISTALFVNFVPAPGALGSADPGACRPTTAFKYQAHRARAVFELDLRSCERSRRIGKVDVSLTIRRCADTCTESTTETVCAARRLCSATVGAPHPSVELATYLESFSFESRGSRVIAGLHAEEFRCYSVVTAPAVGCDL